MPRKTNPDKGHRSRTGGSTSLQARLQRPKPKVDFSIGALRPTNIDLLKQYVTDRGRILPRKYTGLPAHYQRRLSRSIKQARQMLMMK